MEVAPPVSTVAPVAAETHASALIDNIPGVTVAASAVTEQAVPEPIQGFPGGVEAAAPVSRPPQPLIEGFPGGVSPATSAEPAAAPQMIESLPGGVSPAPVAPERPAPAMIESLPGSAADRGSAVEPQPVAPADQKWGGYTGNSFSAPIVGLPAGMTVQEGHVLARQQYAAEAAGTATPPATKPWAYPESSPQPPAADNGGESTTAV